MNESNSSRKHVDEDVSVTSRLRTEMWIQSQRHHQVPKATHTNSQGREAVRLSEEPHPPRDRHLRESSDLSDSDKSLLQPNVSSSVFVQQPSEERNPISMTNKGTKIIAVTNDKLTASLARMNLPKCHSDLFSGDATMFHPWESSFKAMIRDASVTAEQEMNYLYTYTRGAPQKLVNSFRKRQHGNAHALLKDLWAELRKRFGNVAILTNTLLTRLKEAAKFGDKDRRSLQAFSDICTDVSSQIDQLPGLACLNYPHMLKPIRLKWEKEVVEYAMKNDDAYPNFKAFATLIERMSALRNHPNVTAIDSPSKPKEKPKLEHHTTLKGKAEQDEQENDLKHCVFHDRKGHNLTECKTFKRKTLQEKTDWLKQAGCCFPCLTAQHLARDCKAKVKCEKCESTRHLEVIHKEKPKKNHEDDGNREEDEVKLAHTKLKDPSITNASCSKMVLLDVFHQDRPDHITRVYALIDKQSNASMISPQLADSLGDHSPKEKYLLSTCSGSKETKYGRRVTGLVVKSMDGVKIQLPTLIECINIPKDKQEIPKPQHVKKFHHLQDIADEIPPFDSKVQVHLLFGRDAPEIIKVKEVRNGPKGTPWAHRLTVGWTVCGEMCVKRDGEPVHIRTHRTVCEELLHGTIDGVPNQLHKVNTNFATNSHSEILHHKYILCPNTFNVKDPCEALRDEDIFKTSNRDNEQDMSIGDRRFLQIMNNGIHKNAAGNWEMPLPL